jgi:hypothetical protein
MNRTLPIALVVGIVAGSAQAQTGPERPAVNKGVAFLKGHVGELKDAGEAAFSALAMLKAEVPKDDPALVATVARFAVTFGKDGSYTPETRGGPDIYEAAVVVMALMNYDHVDYKSQIDLAAQYVIRKQMANGAWDYSTRTEGDTSMTQYAILALWTAESAGIVVKPEVWDRAARWFLSVQAAGGSWNYHRDTATWPETISMTGAGVGSLMICQRQLARHRKGQDLVNPLMIPVEDNGEPGVNRYKVKTSDAEINAGIAKGMTWLVKNFQVSTDPIMGQSPYYALYGMERLAALDEKGGTMLDSVRWYDRGLDFVMSTQKANGAWHAQHEDLPNTCWAILFATKATIIDMVKIKLRLGGGRLFVGEGLPRDMSDVVFIGNQIVPRPMNGAIEEMLSVLEDAKSMKFESALYGLVAKYQTEGSKVLRPQKDRFRKLLHDREATNRAIGTWALARTDDLDVAPLLIRALLDNDDQVVMEARIGLEFLSRKVEGFGPLDKASPEDKLAAARRWRGWFNSIKPPHLDAPDVDLPLADAPRVKAPVR